MNYRNLRNQLNNDIPNLKIIGIDFGTGLQAFTKRYPEGIILETNEFDEYVVKTSDGVYNFHSNIVIALKFFAKKCQQAPAK